MSPSIRKLFAVLIVSSLAVVSLSFSGALPRSRSLSPSSTRTLLKAQTMSPRRRWLLVGAITSLVGSTSAPANAAADCFSDCLKNCKLIAPKDTDYCTAQCTDYCAQENRNDGLSGSVSATGGEVGILGGTFGQGTVPKGDDKPPSINLPGLDFSSGQGRKLIGY